MKELVIFTDGACSNNQFKCKNAGYGVYFPNKEFNNISNKLIGEIQTNNRAELTAILEALKLIKNIKDTNIIIYSDSRYSIKCITEWYLSWINNNWKTTNNKNVLNADLIKEIINIQTLIKQHNILTYKHINSHTGNKDFISICNDYVDKLAKDGINL